MEDELVDFIERAKSDPNIRWLDEARTKQGIVLKLFHVLGWNVYDVEEVTPEYSVKGGRVDYSLRIKGMNEVFIEVKKAAEELEGHQEQLLTYSFQEGVRLAGLTNGLTWWFYLPLREGNWEQRKFYTIDMLEQAPKDVAAKFVELLSKKNIESGNAVANAESIFQSQQRQNILRKTFPKAWNKIVEEPDELLVELVNETTEKLCGYKAEHELIRRFLMKHRNQFLLSPDLPTRPVARASRKPVEPRKRAQGGSIKQDDFIPILVKVLGRRDGKATKRDVEETIYTEHERELGKDWYQDKVSGDIPRWKHFIAWAKQRAKDIHGYIKSPDESGRGQWELTTKGWEYYEQLKRQS